MAAWRGGERPSRGYWGALALGLGAVIAFALIQGGGTVRLPDLVLLVAITVGGLGYAEGGVLARTYGGWRVICWAIVLALPISVPVTVIAVIADPPKHIALSASAGLAYLGVVSMCLGFFAWYQGMATGGVAAIGQLQLAQPALTLGWSALLLGEHVSLLSAVAAAVVIIATAIGRNAKVERRPAVAAGQASTAQPAADQHAFERHIKITYLMIFAWAVLRQNAAMQPLRFREAGVIPAALLLSVGVALAGCSSGTSSSSTPNAPSAPPSSSSSSSSAPPSSGSSEPASGNGAVAAIKTNWAKFFNAKTPTAQRIALLQNGSGFSSVINSQAGSPLALAATAKVTNVSLTGTTQAAVSYGIYLSGKSALPGQTGVAVYQDGVWKVGDTSFCGLLKLEAGGSSKGLPAGCKG